jgi:hypothetical protein
LRFIVVESAARFVGIEQITEMETSAFDGLLSATRSGTYVATLRKGQSESRKRFTLAHELGHVIVRGSVGRRTSCRRVPLYCRLLAVAACLRRDLERCGRIAVDGNRAPSGFARRSSRADARLLRAPADRSRLRGPHARNSAIARSRVLPPVTEAHAVTLPIGSGIPRPPAAPATRLSVSFVVCRAFSFGFVRHFPDRPCHDRRRPHRS